MTARFLQSYKNDSQVYFDKTCLFPCKQILFLLVFVSLISFFALQCQNQFVKEINFDFLTMYLGGITKEFMWTLQRIQVAYSEN